MKQINNDFVYFQNGEIYEKNKVYYKTNEDLTVDMYKDISFDDKTVLSVVGSGDHILTSNYQFARRTDGFDMSLLAMFYYYLRKWSIMINGDLYPNIYSKSYIFELINKVNPKGTDEKRALEFYKKMLKYHINFESMFYDLYEQPEGKTLFKNPKYLKQYMNKKMRFYHMNLFDENCFIDNEYDIMMISNILDWTRDDQEKLLNAKENIKKLVKNGGYVLCNNMVYRDMNPEREIFSDEFECYDYGMNKGYVYKRTK